MVSFPGIHRQRVKSFQLARPTRFELISILFSIAKLLASAWQRVKETGLLFLGKGRQIRRHSDLTLSLQDNSALLHQRANSP